MYMYIYVYMYMCIYIYLYIYIYIYIYIYCIYYTYIVFIMKIKHNLFFPVFSSSILILQLVFHIKETRPFLIYPD